MPFLKVRIVATAGFAVALAMNATPLMAGPADVNADQFYQTAKQLSSKGMLAMFDKRTKPMMAQMKAAATVVKAENAAAEKASAPLYCVSAAERKKGLGAEEVVTMLGKLPPVERKRSTLAQAWKAALIARYACA